MCTAHNRLVSKNNYSQAIAHHNSNFWSKPIHLCISMPDLCTHLLIGVFYGTYCPTFCRNRGIPSYFIGNWDSLPKPRRRMSFKKAIGMVPAENSSKKISDYDLEGYGSDVRKSLQNSMHDTRLTRQYESQPTKYLSFPFCTVYYVACRKFTNTVVRNIFHLLFEFIYPAPKIDEVLQTDGLILFFLSLGLGVFFSSVDLLLSLLLTLPC